MNYMLITIAFIISLSSIALADNSCPEVDFSNKLPPVGDQKSYGWCYAFSAAALASLEVGHPISAADIALNWGSKENKKKMKQMSAEGKMPNIEELRLPDNVLLDGGQSIYALNSMKIIGGFCAENNFPSIIKQGDIFIEQLYSRSLSLRPSTRELDCKVDNGRSGLRVRQTLRPIDTTALLGIERDKLQALRKQKCLVRMPLPKEVVICGAFNFMDKGKVIAELTQATERLVRQNRLTAIGLAYDQKSGHSVTLVGQRKNPKTNECELIIRNSWGKNCGSVQLKNSDPKWMIANKNKCKNGNFYISKKELAPSVLGVTYFATNSCDPKK